MKNLLKEIGHEAIVAAKQGPRIYLAPFKAAIRTIQHLGQQSDHSGKIKTSK